MGTCFLEMMVRGSASAGYESQLESVGEPRGKPVTGLPLVGNSV